MLLLFSSMFLYFSFICATISVTVMKALDSEDLAIVDTLIESAVYVMCCQDAVNAKANPSAAENTIGISDFFPEIASSYDVTVGGTPKAVPESFSSIKWGQQLAIVYDSLCQIAQTDTALIPALTKNLGSEDYKFDINAIMQPDGVEIPAKSRSLKRLLLQSPPTRRITKLILVPLIYPPISARTPRQKNRSGTNWRPS